MPRVSFPVVASSRGVSSQTQHSLIYRKSNGEEPPPPMGAEEQKKRFAELVKSVSQEDRE